MGFYGNIKNTSRTQFTFDKTYANRAEMDNQAHIDGIYAGRFVLIEYDNRANWKSFPTGYLKDGVVYSTIPNSGEGLPVTYRLTTWIVDNPDTNEGHWDTSSNNLLTPGTIIRIPVEYNFDQTFYTEMGIPTEEPRDIFMVTTNEEKVSTYDDPIKVPIYYYDPVRKVLFTMRDADGNELGHEISYVKMTPFNPNGVSYTGTAAGYPLADMTSGAATDAYNNYIYNYNIDRTQYGVARGYDGTVWQKVYENASAKYVMVAELNSVVPTFDITADAPTTVPILPHFDTDSTNIYYKLHWQPQWGFRIKSSNPDLETPTLFTSGEVTNDGFVKASTTKKEYPSDANTTWINNVYNSNNGTTSERVFVLDNGNGVPTWTHRANVKDDNDQIPAAIYFNKAGFDPQNINYSYDTEYRDWNTEENTEMKYLVTDEITITPSGQSGLAYNAHGTKGVRERVPDTQELAIMLPSIGDSMAQIWDLIYGGRQLNAESKTRELDVSWYNAKAVTNKRGVRLINTLGPGRYSYNPKAASTVAGILNSAQDLMGMIITDELPADVSAANSDYIYYNSDTNKYLFKHKNYEFTKKDFPDNKLPSTYNPYTQVTLTNWDKSHFYIDTATNTGYEYVLENTFYPDRKYIETGIIDNAMQPINLSAEYKPDGTFFIRSDDIYPAGNKYNYFTGSFKPFDEDATYYIFTEAEEQLGSGESVYIPNTYYYYIDYEYVELTNSTYEPNVYYYQWGINNLGFTEYRLAEDPSIEGNYDGMGEQVTAYYKRKYTLDTSLRKRDVQYYRVAPNAEQSSNAYYKQNKYAIHQPDLKEETYTPDTYYYVGTKEDALTAGIYELIDGVYYIRDTSINFSADRDYYSIKIEYELVQGKDVIEITDENAIKVERMRDLTEFIQGGIDLGEGRDVFYLYIDEAGATRYVEVNYNNFDKSYNSITQNYELVIMDYHTVGSPYHPNTYYYKVTDENSSKLGSYLIDNSSNITPGRQYFEFTPTNGVDYGGKFLTGYYASNEFYVESPPNSGNFVLAGDIEMPTGPFFEPTLKLYVMSDTQGIYDVGAEWPMTVTTIPEGVVLGTRTDKWEFKELPSFGDKLITLHGMLLKLYRHLDETDELTRDSTTARGSINLFEDLMHRFSGLVPEQFVVVDDYGRIHSAQHSTSQALTFSNGRTQTAKENALITLEIDGNFEAPTWSITHSSANTIDDTTSDSDMNDGVDTIDLYTPILDNAGHVVAKNTHTVTLPYGFKFVNLANGEATTALTTNNQQIIADNTQDELTVSIHNKWIQIASENNTLKIGHAIVDSNFGEQKDNNQNSAPAFGENIQIPVITVDNAGHVTAFTTEAIRIPGLTYQNDENLTHDVVLNISYSFNEENQNGEFVETRGKVDELLIQDYNITGVASAKLANTDSIHLAFAKLQAQINGMDLEKVGGGDGEYITDISANDGILTVNKAVLPSLEDSAQEGQFISSVSEEYGQVSVERQSFDPYITLVDGTANAAPTINVTVNSKSGTAQSLNFATTEIYGVTKLTKEYSSTSNNLAITGEGVHAAIKTLVTAGVNNIAASKTIKSWSETDGIVSITTQDILITNENIAANAKIAMSKIDGLGQAITDASNALLGDANSAIDSLTIYGLNKKLDATIGSDSDDETILSIVGLSKKTDLIIGSEDDEAELLTMHNLAKRTSAIIGTEEDTADMATIQGLLKKIAELEARIEELHPTPEEELPVEPPIEEEGGETNENGSTEPETP